ncbi:transcriptional regulator [Brevibacillus fluminis]|uniref:Transcriptional regulator n=1 Tax=Brevibacillus fluminis TaxID=511487 RepID=A0A3M8DSI6_9BACL|nr:helix-turn-helix domain-containing protein [Brevibacillus fluminis]RNB91120.1 transcriptional regulator [Brevibacillus fluminis]
MDSDTQKLTSALADPTRFSIYQFVASQKNAVTVQEIADQFTIHPNVARLHLTKLEDVDLLKSISDKSGKGGRPSRLYSLSDQVVNLQFPPRDYRFLADIAIEALLSLGPAGEAALVTMGHRMGIEAAKRAMMERPLNPKEDLEKTLQHMERLVIAQGLKPEIELLDTQTLRFRVYNCTFMESTKRFSGMVCKMHNALLHGIFEAYFGEIELKEEESMLSGCKSCTYTVFRLAEPVQ